MAGFLQVRGLRELQKALKVAGDDLGELKALNGRAAQIVADAAGPHAPRKSGRLSASVRVGATNRAGIVRAGKGSVPYAGVIHWGWSRRGIKAQPWLADAAASSEGRWTDAYKAGVEEILDKVRGSTQ